MFEAFNPRNHDEVYHFRKMSGLARQVGAVYWQVDHGTRNETRPTVWFTRPAPKAHTERVVATLCVPAEALDT